MAEPNNFSGQDEQINCKDCRLPFTFSVGEQLFFTKRDFREKPKRCKSCREKKSGSKPVEVASEPPPPAPGWNGRRKKRDSSVWDE